MDHSTVPTFTDQLKRLFELRQHPAGRPYRFEEVAMALRAEPGKKSGRSYVRALVTGEIEEPGRSTIAALCKFFKVPPAYFFPELDGYVYEPLPEESSTPE